MYCSHWNLAAVLYGWKVGLVWLLCVCADCISGVLAVGFLGALSVLVGGSGFCETEKTWCRNDRVGSYSCHHMDRCYRGGMVCWDGQECGSRLVSAIVSASLICTLVSIYGLSLTTATCTATTGMPDPASIMWQYVQACD